METTILTNKKETYPKPLKLSGSRQTYSNYVQESWRDDTNQTNIYTWFGMDSQDVWEYQGLGKGS